MLLVIHKEIPTLRQRENILKKLAEDGLHPEEILEPIHEMDVSSWDSHVKETWPDYANNLPASLSLLILLLLTKSFTARSDLMTQNKKHRLRNIYLCC